MGVFLQFCHGRRCARSLPHARGGGSQMTFEVRIWSKSSPRSWEGSLTGLAWRILRMSSPRSWGWFYNFVTGDDAHGVFPTLVGVFLKDEAAFMAEYRLPHARGGVSKGNLDFIGSGRSSPRPWGCFRFRRASPGLEKVFPSHVGGFHGQRPCPTNLQVFPTLVKGVVWNQKRLSILIASIEREEQGTSPPIRLSAVQMQFDFGDI